MFNIREYLPRQSTAKYLPILKRIIVLVHSGEDQELQQQRIQIWKHTCSRSFKLRRVTILKEYVNNLYRLINLHNVLGCKREKEIHPVPLSHRCYLYAQLHSSSKIE